MQKCFGFNHNTMVGETMKKLKLIISFFKIIWEMDKKYCVMLLFFVMTSAVMPFVNIYFPMIIVNELSTGKNIQNILENTIIMIALDVTLFFFKGFLERSIQLKAEVVTQKVQALVSDNLASVSYEKLETASFLDLEAKAMFPIVRQNIIKSFFDQIVSIFICVIRLIGLIYILSLLSIWISLFFMLTIGIYCWCHKKLADVTIQFSKELQPINRKFTYYIRMITDFKWAKDIRFFDAEPMLSEKVGQYNEKSYQTLKTVCAKSAKYNCIGKLSSVLQMMVSYIYVARLAILGRILIGQLTMYVSAMVQLAGAASELVAAVITLLEKCVYLEDFVIFQREFINEVNDQEHQGKRECEDIKTIEFRNVSFSYKGVDKRVLDDVSFSIQAGERIAIVGTNGAGKTTIVKLLFGFFRPDSGEILVNGRDMREYDAEGLRRKMTAIFQDFFLPVGKVSDNISIGRKIDQDQYQNAMMNSGFEEVVKDLPFNDNTIIGKQFDKGGIELSGGQRQKLATARMLYKSAEVYVMDEPTASLDPKAEKELYDHFNEFAEKQKHSIFLFISHRLSSCSFCNRILVFHNSKLEEQGEHADLLRRGGLYKEMWDAQRAN